MKYYFYHIAAIVIIGIVVIALLVYKNPKKPETESESPLNGSIMNEPEAQAPAPATFSNHTRTSDEGQVTVEITPIVLQEHENAEFDVSFNTHTVDLNMDMLKVATLMDSAGKTLSPLSWDGPAEGGHHISGKLVFPPLPDPDAGFTITLKDIGGIPERIFEWKMNSTTP